MPGKMFSYPLEPPAKGFYDLLTKPLYSAHGHNSISCHAFSPLRAIEVVDTSTITYK
jgi:hypothetical protein